ncbi:WYL domain-containing protein [Streptomyces sp. E5N91]|uniref:WYL domain-containing protein n=1 Tax=Streptomyces sp. E5N91 TaxID=1851996 RepID=UPI001EE8B560|nr:WYL domain-containing protein [Streptomyces sp. E5N91]
MHRFHLDAPAWFREPATPELPPEPAGAVWTDRTVELPYAWPGRNGVPASALARVVEPYGLVLKAGAWYAGASPVSGRTMTAHWEAGAAAFARTLPRTTVTVRPTGQGLRRLPAVVDGAAIAGALASASVPNPAGPVTLEPSAEYEDVAFDQLARLGADVGVLAPACLRARFRERAAAPAAFYQADPQEA